MNKKIISLYSVFFILSFAVLFLLDLIYKKYVVNLSVTHRYEVWAPQAFSMKENNYQNLLNNVLISKKNRNGLDKENIFRIVNFEILNNNSRYTLNNLNSAIRFELILTNKIDPNLLESELNSEYISSIKKVIDNIEENLFLFDYRTLEKDYNIFRSNEINNAYNKLVNSDFFKKFPPAECNEDKTTCLKIYISYYKYILEQIDINSKNDNLLKFFNITDQENTLISNIIREFYSNRTLFDKDDLFKEVNDSSQSITKHNFFDKKYRQLVNSKFFEDFISNPENYCRTYRDGCFQRLSDYLNTVLYKHKYEQHNKYRVKLLEKKQKDRNNIEELPKILGITIFLNYILFVLTNKYFKRKLR